MSQRLLLASLFLSACLLGCDQANPVAPVGTVLTVSANPSAIGLNGTSTLTVSGFRPDGNPLFPGTLVNLTTTLGTLSTAVVEIGANGRGSATLTGDGRSGPAEITAAAPTTEATATTTVQIGETAETKPVISLTATPDTIGLRETSVVTALARRADGSPFGAGGTVRFRTSLGTIAAEAVTNSNSEARATLTAGDQPGSAVVTASLGSSDEKMVTVTIENRKPALLISANPSNVPVLGSSQITIIARDDNGNPLGAGHRIRLTADLGTVPDAVTTDANGEAEAAFVAGTQAGSGRVTAILGNSDPANVTITIRDAAAFISLFANPRVVNETGGTVQLTATVQNAQGEPLSSAVVSFNAEIGGTFGSGVSVTTNTRGEATNSFTVTEQDIGDETSFDITATVISEGNELSASVTIEVD